MESKSLAKMPLKEEMCPSGGGVTDRCTMYMADKDTIYLVSVSGEITWLSLDEDMQFKLHASSQLSI